LGDRFLLIRFEELCDLPEEGLDRLADFLGRPMTQEEIKRLAATIRRPETFMRYKRHDLKLFDEKQLAAVEKMGFTI